MSKGPFAFCLNPNLQNFGMNRMQRINSVNSKIRLIPVLQLNNIYPKQKNPGCYDQDFLFIIYGMFDY